jgi:hypothetical protein
LGNRYEDFLRRTWLPGKLFCDPSKIKVNHSISIKTPDPHYERRCAGFHGRFLTSSNAIASSRTPRRISFGMLAANPSCSPFRFGWPRSYRLSGTTSTCRAAAAFAAAWSSIPASNQPTVCKPCLNILKLPASRPAFAGRFPKAPSNVQSRLLACVGDAFPNDPR